MCDLAIKAYGSFRLPDDDALTFPAGVELQDSQELVLPALNVAILCKLLGADG